VGIEEERDARREIINLEPGVVPYMDVLDAIAKRNASSCSDVEPGLAMWYR